MLFDVFILASGSSPKSVQCELHCGSMEPPNVFISLFEYVVALLKSTILSLPFFNEPTPSTVLLLGLDYAGKTTLSEFLCSPSGRKIPTLKPTVRPSSRSFSVGNKTFLAYDMGGCEGVREVRRGVKRRDDKLSVLSSRISHRCLYMYYVY
jgi:hypothetical protein